MGRGDPESREAATRVSVAVTTKPVLSIGAMRRFHDWGMDAGKVDRLRGAISGRPVDAASEDCHSGGGEWILDGTSNSQF